MLGRAHQMLIQENNENNEVHFMNNKHRTDVGSWSVMTKKVKSTSHRAPYLAKKYVNHGPKDYNLRNY